LQKAWSIISTITMAEEEIIHHIGQGCPVIVDRGSRRVRALVQKDGGLDVVPVRAKSGRQKTYNGQYAWEALGETSLYMGAWQGSVGPKGHLYTETRRIALPTKRHFRRG